MRRAPTSDHHICFVAWGDARMIVGRRYSFEVMLAHDAAVFGPLLVQVRAVSPHGGREMSA